MFFAGSQRAVASVNHVAAELLDSANNVVAGFSRDDCAPIAADTFSEQVSWAGGNIPSGSYKLRFYLAAATLYSFKVVGTIPKKAELFLDQVDIDSHSGVTFGINRPVKYSGNPTFGGTGTWDINVGGGEDVIKYTDTEFGFFYNCDYGACYAYSNDGTDTWVKPNLGLISYGGNTNNNLLEDQGLRVIYCPTLSADKRYLATSGSYLTGTPGNLKMLVYKSRDGINNWTLVKDLTDAGVWREIHTQMVNNDGRLVITYVNVTPPGYLDRAIGIAISDSTDFTGSYTFHDWAIPAVSGENQKYHMGIQPYGDVYLGICSTYDSVVTDLFLGMELYISRNCVNWTLLDAGWVPAGVSPNDWDCAVLLTNCNPFTRIGDVERLYYSGWKGTHTSGVNPRVGYASFGRERIGQVSGSGIVTSSPITFSGGEKVMVNMKDSV